MNENAEKNEICDLFISLPFSFQLFPFLLYLCLSLEFVVFFGAFEMVKYYILAQLFVASAVVAQSTGLITTASSPSESSPPPSVSSPQSASAATLNPVTYTNNGYTITGSFEYNTNLSVETQWPIQPLTGSYNSDGSLVTTATSASSSGSSSRTGTTTAAHETASASNVASASGVSSTSAAQKKNGASAVTPKLGSLAWWLLGVAISLNY